MCFKKIKELLKPSSQAQLTSIPHPEEKCDKSLTVNNISISAILAEWFEKWEVPKSSRDFFSHSVTFRIYDEWPQSMLSMGINKDTPACTWSVGEERFLASLASWFNKGVVAHEQAHVSYSLLTDDQKKRFEEEFKNSLITDYLVIMLDKDNSYMNSSTIEGHAEIYRYLGQYMPEQLKQFYPKLF